MAPHYPASFIVCGMFSFEFFPRIRVGNFIWNCIKKCERSHYQWLYSSKLLPSGSYPPSVMPLTSALASNLRSGSCDGLADSQGRGRMCWKRVEGFWRALGKGSAPGAEDCLSPETLRSHL